MERFLFFLNLTYLDTIKITNPASLRKKKNNISTHLLRITSFTETSTNKGAHYKIAIDNARGGTQMITFST